PLRRECRDLDPPIGETPTDLLTSRLVERIDQEAQPVGEVCSRLRYRSALGAEEAADPLGADAADQQAFLAVAEQRPRPIGEAAVGKLVLDAPRIGRVDFEAQLLVVAATGGSVRI